MRFRNGRLVVTPRHRTQSVCEGAEQQQENVRYVLATHAKNKKEKNAILKKGAEVQMV
jgi:hypothetical protein